MKGGRVSLRDGVQSNSVSMQYRYFLTTQSYAVLIWGWITRQCGDHKLIVLYVNFNLYTNLNRYIRYETRMKQVRIGNYVNRNTQNTRKCTQNPRKHRQVRAKYAQIRAKYGQIRTKYIQSRTPYAQNAGPGF